MAILCVVRLLWQGAHGDRVQRDRQAGEPGLHRCHDKPGSKLLTDEGKYYELMGTLDGFDDVTQVFGECTTCHVKKPGSAKLTQTGRLFQRLIDDMSGLRTYLQEQHPVGDAPEEAPSGD